MRTEVLPKSSICFQKIIVKKKEREAQQSKLEKIRIKLHKIQKTGQNVTFTYMKKIVQWFFDRR
jgi:hypothetical protein